MRRLIFISLVLLSQHCFAQSDSAQLEALGRTTVMSEVIIRSDLNVVSLLRRIKEDTSFYKAFRNLRVLQFTSINDIKMLDKRGAVEASLYSKTAQLRQGGCRTMQVLEEKTAGDMYKKGKLDYFTAELYAGLFFTTGKVCSENNTVTGAELNIKGKSGIEKHKEQLKMMFFNPGKKIPGIPFIGDRIDIFDPEIAKQYNFSIDADAIGGQDCYLFKIIPRADLTKSELNDLVFKNITTWFNTKTLEIVARNYDLSYNTLAYDFDVRMEVEMTRFKNYLVPAVLRYTGNWKVAFKKRERAFFTATLSDFKEEQF